MCLLKNVTSVLLSDRQTGGGIKEKREARCADSKGESILRKVETQF